MIKRILFICLFTMCIAVHGYNYNANDFAVEVIEYNEPGDYPYDDPANALGRPSIESPTGSGIPLVIAAQSYGQGSVVTIPVGSQLILKFGRDVTDDPDNPYGIDFIVFGNAFINVTVWENGDPNGFVLGSGIYIEPAIVSVCYDLQLDNWVSFDWPRADTFAPTQGREYVTDSADADPALGAWNLWWGGLADPTVPIDPNLALADVTGMRMDQFLLDRYGHSAGGTGFDLKETGFTSIRYIKIQSTFFRSEIDAVADVAPMRCGYPFDVFPYGDIDQDCIVGMSDVALMARKWLDAVENTDSVNLADGDDLINQDDLSILAQFWLNETLNFEDYQ
jgi:hypothetical protein